MAAVDEFDLAEASDGGGGGASVARSPRRSRSGAWPWVATAAALVLVGALNATPTPIVLGQPGIEFGLLALDVSTAPEVVWESDLTDSYINGSWDDSLVLISDDTGQDRSVLGLDLETGAEVWRYHDVGYTCQWSTAVVCVEEPGTPDAVIITIDSDDGARLSQPYPGALAAIKAASGTVIVVEVTETVNEDVVLIEADGSERWRVSADAAQTESEQLWVWLNVYDEVVTLALTGTSIDLETGALSGSQNWKLPGGAEVEFTPDGTMVLHTTDRQIALGPNEQLIPYDDDFGGPVMVQQLANEVLTASRRVDATELWQVGTPSCHPVARLRGTLATQCWEETREQIIALNELTGETRWELPNATMVAASAESLLVVDRTEGTLLGIDPADGSTRWTLPTRLSGYPNITPLSDGVLLVGENGLVRLRWS